MVARRFDRDADFPRAGDFDCRPSSQSPAADRHDGGMPRHAHDALRSAAPARLGIWPGWWMGTSAAWMALSSVERPGLRRPAATAERLIDEGRGVARRGPLPSSL